MEASLRLSFVPLVLLLAGPAGAQDAAVVVSPGAGRTVTVEVLGFDAAAGTLSFRVDDADTTLAVDPSALAAMREVRAGDRIVIALRDDPDHRQVVSALVNGAVTGTTRSSVTLGPAERVTVRSVPGTAVEVVSTERSSGAITVRSDDGEHVYVLPREAARDLDGLDTGSKVLLSWRYRKDGRPEAVIRPVPASYVAGPSGPAETVSTGPGPVRVLRPAAQVSAELPDRARGLMPHAIRGPVEVVATDVTGRTATLIDETGEQFTVPVDDRALYGLSSLRPGDRVELSWGPNERIVYFKLR